MELRYIPFTQQAYCCVPACFQMIMYKHAIPLLAQEEIAYELGLTVPDKDAHLFAKVRTGKKPPAGWGTQINKPEFSVNKVFAALGIPISMERLSTKDFKSPNELGRLLHRIQSRDGDALLCFDYGKLWGLDYKGGHVCVFNSVNGAEVTIVDPERNVPKLRTTTLDRLHEAMDFHGDHNSTGVWSLNLN